MTSIRSFVAAATVAGLVLAQPGIAGARDTTQAEEAGLALAAVGANIVYVPAKAVVAVGGAMLGSLVGFLTGGDTRSAYAIWVPAAGGTYILRAANMDGSEPIAFFGSDYADQPSPLAQTASGDGGAFYEAQYPPRPETHVSGR